MRNRLVNYDLLRIAAAYLIVLLHLSVPYVCQAPESFQAYVQWEYAIALSAFSRIGVPVFIMLSGLFLLHPRKELPIYAIFTKYLPKIVFIFIVWFFFYAFAEQDFYRQLWASGFDFRYCWEQIDSSFFWGSVWRGHYHMWYLYMLAGLYLITPFVRILANHATNQQLCYFLSLCIGITFITKFNDDLWKLAPLSEILNALSLAFVLGYVGYFLAGYFLDKRFSMPSYSDTEEMVSPLNNTPDWKVHLYRPFIKLREGLYYLDKGAIFIYLLGAVAFIFMVSQTIQLNPMFGFRTPELILFSNYSPTVFLMSFAVFTFTAKFKNISFPSMIRNLANKLSKHMLFVYMIHPFIITEMRKTVFLSGSTFAFSLLFDALVVFLISLGISIVLRQPYQAACLLKKATKRNAVKNKPPESS